MKSLEHFDYDAIDPEISYVLNTYTPRFFPLYPNWQFSVLLPPLEVPYHMWRVNGMSFREGGVGEKGVNNGDDDIGGSLLNYGVPNLLVQRTWSLGDWVHFDPLDVFCGNVQR